MNTLMQTGRAIMNIAPITVTAGAFVTRERPAVADILGPGCIKGVAHDPQLR
jgi:hypothetical protein